MKSISYLLKNILFISMLIFSANTYAANTITWNTYSDAAFQAAKKENKNILLFIKAEWCHWCQLMKAETFQDENVVKRVNNNFIPVRVDVDNDAGILREYRVRSVPMIIILNTKKQIIRTYSGYMTADELTNKLDNH